MRMHLVKVITQKKVYILDFARYLFIEEAGGKAEFHYDDRYYVKFSNGKL